MGNGAFAFEYINEKHSMLFDLADFHRSSCAQEALYYRCFGDAAQAPVDRAANYTLARAQIPDLVIICHMFES